MEKDNTWVDKWVEDYKQTDKKGKMMKYPSEILVRMFKGNYVSGLPKSCDGLKILDVGAGDGNNSEFLHDLGFELYATEINDYLVSRLQRRMNERGIKSCIKVGYNCRLPFTDNYFDFLISWNVIHYCDSVSIIEKSIEEYCRVLSPGGFLFLSTQGLLQRQIRTAKRVSEYVYSIDSPDDLRHGQKMFCFETKSKMSKFFDQYFNNIKISRCFLETMGFDWFILSSQKI